MGKTKHGVTTFVKNFIKFNSKDQIDTVIGKLATQEPASISNVEVSKNSNDSSVS